RRLELARPRFFGDGFIVRARLRDRLLRGFGRFGHVFAEEAAALMRPQPRVQAVAREEAAGIAFFHDPLALPRYRGASLALRKIVLSPLELCVRAQDFFFLSSRSLRFANGECVAPPRVPGILLPPLAASSCRWCSLSWQYRHSSSQLLPSGGL